MVGRVAINVSKRAKISEGSISKVHSKCRQVLGLTVEVTNNDLGSSRHVFKFLENSTDHIVGTSAHLLILVTSCPPINDGNY